MINAHLESAVVGEEHWTEKGDVKLFMWNKFLPDTAKKRERSCLCTARPWHHNQRLTFMLKGARSARQ